MLPALEYRHFVACGLCVEGGVDLGVVIQHPALNIGVPGVEYLGVSRDGRRVFGFDCRDNLVPCILSVVAVIETTLSIAPWCGLT
jgi:hypothetical protein